MPKWIFAIVAIALGFSATQVFAQNPTDWASLMLIGQTERQQGRIELSIAHLRQAESFAGNDQERSQSFTELGVSLRQARRLNEAELALQSARALTLEVGEQRAKIEFELGSLATLHKDETKARRHYLLAQEIAGKASPLGIRASLNLLRPLEHSAQLAHLNSLFDQIAAGAQTQFDAHLYLQLGHQAGQIAKTGLPLAFRSLDRARALTAKSAEPKNRRLHLESLDELAQLYEQQARHADALTLTQAALQQLRADNSGNSGDLQIAFEWRMARLYQALGQDQLALAAYQRAANQLELLRQDIPIDYDDGSSSFRTTFEPIYLGLIDMLLKNAAVLPETAPEESRELLLRAQNLLELMKQTELQDYLADRCALDAVKGGSATVIPAGSLIVQPIILADRIELLVQTSEKISRFSSPVKQAQVVATARKLADGLREKKADYLVSAQQLYDWLLRPLEDSIRANKIDTIVFVADTSLRTMPLAALHDGHQYAIEKYAVANVTGLSMTNTSAPPKAAMTALIAGASSFGLAVEKYASLQSAGLAELAESAAMPDTVSNLDKGRLLRSVSANTKRQDFRALSTRAEQLDALRTALALPGVSKEVYALRSILPGSTLLDAEFTLNAFTLAAQSAQYRILHVASHGMFGGSASTSYILTYDDFLTLDGLQSMLKGEQFQQHPIELLSLSACETAAGNERAPLGISGAAMKARARSVLGTLWPVDDEAAVKIMGNFYSGLAQQKLSKAQALRQAQMKLLRQPQLSHPFFWAPFALIGNWL